MTEGHEGGFLYREGLRYVPDRLTYDELPERARNGIYTELAILFRTNLGITLATPLYEAICRRTRERFTTAYTDAVLTLEKNIWPFIRKADWSDVLAIIEDWLQSRPQSLRRNGIDTTVLRGFVSALNALFLEEGIGWSVGDDWRIARRQSAVLDSGLKEAGMLLRDPRFTAADQLWRKAVDALNRIPEPDIENCIKDAVAAVESAVASLHGGSVELDRYLKDMARQGRIPKPLDESFAKVYAYRGNQPGVSHGSASPLTARVPDAEYVLNWAAAAIVYFTKI